MRSVLSHHETLFPGGNCTAMSFVILVLRARLVLTEEIESEHITVVHVKY